MSISFVLNQHKSFSYALVSATGFSSHQKYCHINQCPATSKVAVQTQCSRWFGNSVQHIYVLHMSFCWGFCVLLKEWWKTRWDLVWLHFNPYSLEGIKAKIYFIFHLNLSQTMCIGWIRVQPNKNKSWKVNHNHYVWLCLLIWWAMIHGRVWEWEERGWR